MRHGGGAGRGGAGGLHGDREPVKLDVFFVGVVVVPFGKR